MFRCDKLAPTTPAYFKNVFNPLRGRRIGRVNIEYRDVFKYLRMLFTQPLGDFPALFFSFAKIIVKAQSLNLFPLPDRRFDQRPKFTAVSYPTGTRAARSVLL